MKQTWRWFGPHDQIPLSHIRQAGVEGIVSALHHIDSGAVWSPQEIKKRQQEIAFDANGTPTGLNWDVVESLVVSEDIKKQTGDFKLHFASYRHSLENLAAAGIKTICYNFMPVLDWTRTDLAWPLANGGTAMRFDLVDFAVFDIHLLQRDGASETFEPEIVAAAARRFPQMSDKDKSALINNIVAGLPGANEHLTLDQVRHLLDQYRNISADQLVSNLIDFLSEVAPLAEKLGMRLCCHPDDPPFELLGLPRIMSTAQDYQRIFAAVDIEANGMTFCTGSFGARPDNDLLDIFKQFAPRIHFVHLRNVKRDNAAIPGSFFEDEHLAGDADMVAIIAAILAEEKQRRKNGRPDHQIPMRPDHGQDIVSDLGRNGGQPGYPIVGRLKGLAELRGIMVALQHPVAGSAL
ncbi:Mannonate dehydratase [hydrothermal vent metagenome]|uniref:mannonate dehydratase n=1 Tax=hydrothermal vent metagenome TaxID=652676 RepID=A0A3B0TRD0_9ZZZZ